MWQFKSDSEGGEYSLLNDLNSINILKKASHIAFEIHMPGAPSGRQEFLKNRAGWKDIHSWYTWFESNFSNTHFIIRTSHPKCDRIPGLASIVLVKKDIINEKNKDMTIVSFLKQIDVI